MFGWFFVHVCTYVCQRASSSPWPPTVLVKRGSKAADYRCWSDGGGGGGGGSSRRSSSSSSNIACTACFAARARLAPEVLRWRFNQSFGPHDGLRSEPCGGAPAVPLRTPSKRHGILTILTMAGGWFFTNLTNGILIGSFVKKTWDPNEP